MQSSRRESGKVFRFENKLKLKKHFKTGCQTKFIIEGKEIEDQNHELKITDMSDDFIREDKEEKNLKAP